MKWRLYPHTENNSTFFIIVKKAGNFLRDFNNKELIKELFESGYKFKLGPGFK